MAGNFFRGTSLDQDPRFKDKQAALMRKTQFPPSFDTKVRSDAGCFCSTQRIDRLDPVDRSTCARSR
jgi:hypothetical protein